MKAILVSVDYSDLLALTLPHNRHHFDEVMVVTTFTDVETIRVAGKYGAKVYATEAFYENGAVFNKFKALEEGLDRLGRDGWLCIMDADVLWPKDARNFLPSAKVFNCSPVIGNLYTPRRRMMEDVTRTIPQEEEWYKFPLHPQSREFAGYTQIFHASDPVLGKTPWHETNWSTAGGADSFFQAKWKDENKIRPSWEVLHLGPAGVNWCGRASKYVSGETPVDSESKVCQLRSMISKRKQGPGRFDGEKIL